MKTLVLLCLVVGSLVSKEDVFIEKSQTRIASHQIWLNENKIFIENSNRNWVQVPVLYQDAEGLYVFDGDPNTDLVLVWFCGKCGKVNSWSDQECWNCGHR